VTSDDWFFTNNAEKENLKTSPSEVLCIEMRSYCTISLF